MYALTTYEQTAVFDPTDPTQRIREGYAGQPGTWASWYFNRVPTESTLGGAGLGLSFATLPSWAQVGLVGAVSAAIGYFGMKKFGDSHVKPMLKKVGLGGARARRRRRR